MRASVYICIYDSVRVRVRERIPSNNFRMTIMGHLIRNNGVFNSQSNALQLCLAEDESNCIAQFAPIRLHNNAVSTCIVTDFQTKHIPDIKYICAQELV